MAVLANEELPGVRKAANWRAKDVLPDILALPSFLVKETDESAGEQTTQNRLL